MDFGRLITAMVTPFDNSLAINWEQTGKLIDRLIEQEQSDAIVVSGTTGESPTLTDEEKVELFRFAVRHAAGRCKIIAGTGGNDTAHAIHLSKLAEEAGVDGLLLVAPYYNRPSDEGLYRHFKAIADSTTLPIMLYNIPSRTGVDMSATLTLRLAREVTNIVAMKESTGNLDQISAIVAGAPEGFYVYSGDDSLTLPVLSVGGYGIVSVASHVAGSRMKDMIDAFVAGDTARAATLHGKLLPIFRGIFFCPHRVPNPAPIKYALKLHGIDCGGLRLPLVEVAEGEAEFIRKLFEE